VSINRSGKPSRQQDWMKQVEWVAANVFDTKTWAGHLENAYAIVSCLGAFSMNKAELERLNGDTTLVAADLSLSSSEGANLKKFIFVSATEGTEAYTKMLPFLKGYLDGKRKVEQFLLHQWAPAKQTPDSPSPVLILRPGFIYGPKTVQVANQPVNLPLHWLGRPLEMIMKPVWSRLSVSSDSNSSTSEAPDSSLKSDNRSRSGSTSSKSTTSSTNSWTQLLKMMTEPPISVECVAASVVEAVSPNPNREAILSGIIDVKTMNENFSRIHRRDQQQNKSDQKRE